MKQVVTVLKRVSTRCWQRAHLFWWIMLCENVRVSSQKPPAELWEIPRTSNRPSGGMALPFKHDVWVLLCQLTHRLSTLNFLGPQILAHTTAHPLNTKRNLSPNTMVLRIYRFTTSWTISALYYVINAEIPADFANIRAPCIIFYRHFSTP